MSNANRNLTMTTVKFFRSKICLARCLLPLVFVSEKPGFPFGWLKIGTSALSAANTCKPLSCRERGWHPFDFHKSIDVSAFLRPRGYLFFKNMFRSRKMKVFFRI